MFTLELYDRKGVKLQLGDLVKSRDQIDIDPEAGERYLMSWKTYEYKLEQKMFRIKILQK